MKKIILLVSLLILMMGITACGSSKSGEKGPAKEKTAVNSDVTFKAYFTEDHVDENGDIPIYFVVKNNTDEPVEVNETDFTLRTMEKGEALGYGPVHDADAEPQAITVEAHAKGYFLSRFVARANNTDKIPGPIDIKNFDMIYDGPLIETQEAVVPLGAKPPKNYADTLPKPEEEIETAEADEIETDTDWTEDDFEGADEPGEINGYIPMNRFKVTGYHLVKANGGKAKIHIRVENLTDEDQHYDARKLKIFDAGEEYDLAPVRDDAFDPDMTVPAHGKVDYMEFYLLRSDYDDRSTDEIIDDIYGVRYEDDQFWEVIEVTGKYVEELPDDFSDE